MRWRSSIHALRPSGGLAAPIFWAGDFGRQEVTSRLGSHCVVQENDLVQMEGLLLQRDELS